jgi:hypothetical protein
MAIGDTGDNGVHLLRAEVADVAQQAGGADARASEALRRVRGLREDLDATQQDLGVAIAATQADLIGCEARLCDRIDALEVVGLERHTETVGHLTQLWQATVTLRDRPAPPDRMPLYALAVVLAVALQQCGGV